MAAPRSSRDVVRALLAAVPSDKDPLIQVTVANPPTTGTKVNVLLNPNTTTVTPVRRFGFVTAPAAGDTVWLIPMGRTYLCLGSLA